MTTLLGIDLAGRLVVLVGGGSVAARRAAALMAEGANLRVVAPELDASLRELHEAGAIEWRGREARDGDLEGAWLVQTATGDAEVDATVADWAEAKRIWCINAGSAQAGTARTPAVAKTGGIVLGVVSERGADPRRSMAIRDALAEQLREGTLPLRRRRPSTGRVILVGGGPGAVDLLTLRGRRAIAQADVVVTDRLGPIGVLAELDPAVEVIDVGKSPGNHPVPQHEINRILVEQARLGRVVVRLKGGDPFVYGRGGEEVIACREAGVDVEVVPGISSAMSVPAGAGIPLTHRGVATSAHIVNGQDPVDEATLAALRDPQATTVILMGVSALARIAARALEAGAAGSTPVAIVESGHTRQQRVSHGRLDRIAEIAQTVGVQNPAVIVIGAVARPGLLHADELVPLLGLDEGL